MAGDQQRTISPGLRLQLKRYEEAGNSEAAEMSFPSEEKAVINSRSGCLMIELPFSGSWSDGRQLSEKMVSCQQLMSFQEARREVCSGATGTGRSAFGSIRSQGQAESEIWNSR